MKLWYIVASSSGESIVVDGVDEPMNPDKILC